MKCRTFVVAHEAHTFGNSVRWMLARNEDTEFAGYTVPHPSEPFLQIRVQTKGPSATELFGDSLKSLMAICDHISDTFETATEASVDVAMGEEEH